MTDDEIIEEAKKYIKEQGKANITWLLKHLKEEGKLQESDNDNNRADNLACQMEATDFYIIYFLPQDPNQILVKRNPNFGLNENIKATNLSSQSLNTSLKRTNTKMWIIAAITGAFIASQFLRDIFSDRKPTYIQSEQIKQDLDSLNQSLHGIDSSISRAVYGYVHFLYNISNIDG